MTIKWASLLLGCAICLPLQAAETPAEPLVPQSPELEPPMYRGCFMLPQFVLPKFFLPDFQQRLKDLPDFEPIGEQTKSEFVRPVFLKPEMVSPVILRPQFENCVTRRLEPESEGGYRVVPVVIPEAAAAASPTTASNRVARAEAKPSAPAPAAHPNEAFFYKPPPAPQVADCCGGKDQKSAEVRTLPEAPKIKIQ